MNPQPITKLLLSALGPLAALALVLMPSGAVAATPEDRVKAAYLFKLASFVRWPNDSGREFRICVAGSSDVVQVLRSFVRDERVLGRPVVVTPIDSSQTARVSSCQVLYLARGPETARTLLAAANGLPVFTIADRDGGTRGGVLDFVIRDGKVRFLIDRSLAQRQRLNLSSKLLSIALAVER